LPSKLAAHVAACSLAVCLGATAHATPAAGERSYAVIVSKSVDVDGLSLDELRRILTFKRTQWKGGRAITLLLPGGSLPARSFILSRLYGMSDDELRRFILQRIFQAEIDFAPKVVSVERDAIAFVASGQSVIAIVSASTPGLDAVKTLRIDGRIPGQAGYPLQ
jgi:hypothetical protein